MLTDLLIAHALLAVVIVWLLRLKRVYANGLVGEFRRVETSEFPGADLQELKRVAAEYEALGFSYVADFTIDRPNVKTITALARLMFNVESGVTVTMTQLFDSAGRCIRKHSVVSSDLEQNWSICTADFGSGASWPLRHPRIIGCYLTGAKPDALFAEHLSFRQKVSKELGLRVLFPTSYENHVATLQRQAAERREIIDRKSSLKFILELFYSFFRRRNEWLGDYACASNCR